MPYVENAACVRRLYEEAPPEIDNRCARPHIEILCDAVVIIRPE